MLSEAEAGRLVEQHLGGTRVAPHAVYVGEVLAAIAKRLRQPEALWRVTGWCHDLDYFAIEGDWSRHGVLTAEWLAGRLPAEALEAIAAHDHRTGRVAAGPLADMLKLADALAVAVETLGGRAGFAARLRNREPGAPLVAGKPYLDAIIAQAAARHGIVGDEIAALLPAQDQWSR
ncbi:hypothetical protein [Devosia geojensis]|uniref:hypothetical protein n=1 Tax=Devosia geojensis TaxID=443610 RepID=UPI0006986D85|nr:hypothetical protein [Devosia geojensis]